MKNSAKNFAVTVLTFVIVASMVYLVSIVPSESQVYETAEFNSTNAIIAFIVMIISGSGIVNLFNKKSIN